MKEKITYYFFAAAFTFSTYTLLAAAYNQTPNKVQTPDKVVIAHHNAKELTEK